MNGVPEGGATRGCLKEIPVREVFRTEEIDPEASLTLRHLPDPFAHECNIHQLGVDDPKAPLGFRSTNGLPFNHMVFPFRSRSFPKETGPGSVHPSMHPIGQKEQPHCKLGQRGEARICEHQPGCGGEKLSPPRANPSTHLGPQRGPTVDLNAYLPSLSC